MMGEDEMKRISVSSLEGDIAELRKVRFTIASIKNSSV